MENLLTLVGVAAKESGGILAGLLSSQKDTALLAIADELENNMGEIEKANKLDLDNAAQAGLSPAMQDRLKLDPPRIIAMAEAVRQVALLSDPVGKILSGETRPNGLEITKISVPLGVIGVIYESRPNVTIDCAVLCLKSGNACILRGGSEAINSNKVLCQILQAALEKAGLPKNAVQLVENTSREYATALMTLTGYVDALIPRGGKGLIESVVDNAKVPVIETGAGTCHIYVDQSANLEMAVNILDNAKTSRPSVCNAVETLLVHKNIAEKLLPMVAKALANVEFVCDDTSLPFFHNGKLATSDSWYTEYNDYILNVRIIENTQQAIAHIEKYSTGHSDAIITESYSDSQSFTGQVDSAAVYVNASTRFTDGGEFGFGAEIGIATQKLHVRGPMGLEALTSSKYIVRGNGQVR